MNQSARSRRMLTAAVIVLASFLAGGCGSDEPNKPPSGGGTTLELNSPNLGNTGVYAHTFMTAGTFPYHCKFHSSMTSSVVVQAGAPAAAAVTISDNSFSGAATVAPGGTVTWTNNGGNTHSVTSD